MFSVSLNISRHFFVPHYTRIKTCCFLKKNKKQCNQEASFQVITFFEVSIGVTDLHYGYTKHYNPHPLLFALLCSPADPPAAT